jgi:D-psicose/D-tagatose/L-ribulose 3-epimerase
MRSDGCTRDALVHAAYTGPICIESFTAENQTIARAASIWRPLERTQDAIATDGLRYLTETLTRSLRDSA